MIERLQAEVAALQRRVVELETASAVALSPSRVTPEDGGTFTASTEMLDESRALLTSLVSYGPTVVFVKDVSGRYALINRTFSALFGQAPEAVFGKTDYELFPAEVATRIRRVDEGILAEGCRHEYEGTIPTAYGDRTFSTLKFPVYRGQGGLLGLVGFSSDITDLRRAEAERDVMQRRALNAHAAVLRELEAPVVPIAKGVFAVPLVGALDEERARRVEAIVLSGVSERQAAWVILDVTGMRSIDAAAIGALNRIAQGAQLLGARVLVTGIRPAVAMALGALADRPPGFIPLATLECGIAYALRLGNRAR